jgi:hypothetical protein
MPARWVPLLYFALAHASLATALALVALEPGSFAGFFYHPRMLAVVHLVTLGWISASILGSLYVVGPLAFRMPLPARAGDYLAFGSFAVGLLGMVSHFWIDRPSGMAWGAGLVAISMSYVAARGLLGLRTAPVPSEARLPMALALLNMMVAAGLGLLVAVNKVLPFLPVAHLDVVFAHAHVAALGWGTMMVVGAGYRILPMILPAAMPRGPWAWAAPLLLEAGVVGLAGSFLAHGRGLVLSALLAVAGIAAFLSRVAWMLHNRRPPPSELRHPDWGVAHALQGLVCLALACVLGLYLAAAERSQTTLAVASAYGVLGLLGFLSQMIVGVEARLLPLFAWLWGFADRGYAAQPPSPHRAPSQPLLALAFLLWTAGVPLLGVGLASARASMISSGSGALLLAVFAGLGSSATVLARLWRQ